MLNIEKVELREVINLLGEPTRQDGKHYYFQCPECRDKSQNNLIYTESNGLLKSFCCESSKKVYGEIMKARKGNKPTYFKQQKPFAKSKRIKPLLPDTKLIEFSNYQHECNKNLLTNKEALKYLFDKRGITEQTIIDTGLGLDTNKIREINKDGKVIKLKSKVWVLPVYDLVNGQYRLIGFEYRGASFDKKVIFKEDNTYSCLANINAKIPPMEALIMLEGFWDGYCFWQHLKEQGQSDYYHILSPSNGVGSILNCLEDINFENYKKVILYLDSDDKGIQAMQKIKEKYPFVEIIVMTCGCKDFNEHYLNCLRLKQAS
jgi:hypothetical protein